MINLKGFYILITSATLPCDEYIASYTYVRLHINLHKCILANIQIINRRV